MTTACSNGAATQQVADEANEEACQAILPLVTARMCCPLHAVTTLATLIAGTRWILCEMREHGCPPEQMPNLQESLERLLAEAKGESG